VENRKKLKSKKRIWEISGVSPGEEKFFYYVFLVVGFRAAD